MTVTMLALIENELTGRRGLPAFLESENRVFRLVVEGKRIKLQMVDDDPTLTCKVFERGGLIETIESSISSGVTHVKTVADWIERTYSKALADARTRDTRAEPLSAFTEEEQGFLTEGLQALLKVKKEAFETVHAAGVAAAYQQLTERDFGIPQIRALYARIMDAFYGKEETEEQHEDQV